MEKLLLSFPDGGMAPWCGRLASMNGWWRMPVGLATPRRPVYRLAVCFN
jgi:hypothetical protein